MKRRVGGKWTPCEEDFELPHRPTVQRVQSKKLMPAQLTDDNTLLVAPPGQATWDALSTAGLFNFTMGKKHDFKKKGLEEAAKLLGKQSNSELPPFYWMVPQANFDQGDFRLPTEYVEIEHRMIPRTEPSPALIKSVLVDILRRKADQLNCSAELKAVIMNRLKVALRQLPKPLQPSSSSS
jgi:hypothetical protein